MDEHVEIAGKYNPDMEAILTFAAAKDFPLPGEHILQRCKAFLELIKSIDSDTPYDELKLLAK
jgi:hypothetical protein